MLSNHFHSVEVFPLPEQLRTGQSNFKPYSCATNSYNLVTLLLQLHPKVDSAMVGGWARAEGRWHRHVWVRSGDQYFDPTWEFALDITDRGPYWAGPEWSVADKRVQRVEEFFQSWIDDFASPPAFCVS